jgi:hypothetical protein
MSLASDQDAGGGKLSGLGQQMRELRELVLAEWEADPAEYISSAV